MDQGDIIKPSAIDTTGGSSEPQFISPDNSPSGSKSNKIYIRYITFERYKVGLIEDENHRTIGIKSIEIIKDLYNNDQLSKKFNYWDVEEYYK